VSVLRHRKDAVPIDMVIDMGGRGAWFLAAVENALFLYSRLAGTTLNQIVATGDFRLSARLFLHVFSSAIIGVALGLAFLRSRTEKNTIHDLWSYPPLSFCMVPLNLLIRIHARQYMLLVFAAVWCGDHCAFGNARICKNAFTLVPRGIMESPLLNKFFLMKKPVISFSHYRITFT